MLIVFVEFFSALNPLVKVFLDFYRRFILRRSVLLVKPAYYYLCHFQVEDFDNLDHLDDKSRIREKRKKPKPLLKRQTIAEFRSLREEAFLGE